MAGITIQGGSPTLQGGPLTVLGTASTPQVSSSIPIQGTNTPTGVSIVPKVTAAPAPTVDPYAAQTAALIAQLKAAQQPVYAPKLDLAAVNASARASAESAVNPFYVKTLNDFLSQQATEKAQQEQQTKTNIQNFQDALTQTQDANATTGARSAEDTATTEANVNKTADQFQTDSGQAFDKARIAAATAAAAGGLSGGVAAGQAEDALTAHNTTESRQADAFQEQKDQAELLKGRTLEDIATSNTNAATGEKTSETQANFDLDKYLTSADTTEANERNTLEQQRLAAIQTETSNQSKLAFTKYLSGISDPAQYLAALQTYGSSF